MTPEAAKKLGLKVSRAKTFIKMMDLVRNHGGKQKQLTWSTTAK
jgi:predicted DNA-binding helix-hairpin-helix protein